MKRKRKFEFEKETSYDLNINMSLDEFEGIKLNFKKKIKCEKLFRSKNPEWDISSSITNKMETKVKKYQKDYNNRRRLISFGRKLESEKNDVYFLINNRESGESFIYASPFYRTVVEPSYKKLYIKTENRNMRIRKILNKDNDDNKMDIDIDNGKNDMKLDFVKKRLLMGNGTKKEYASGLFRLTKL